MLARDSQAAPASLTAYIIYTVSYIICFYNYLLETPLQKYNLPNTELCTSFLHPVLTEKLRDFMGLLEFKFESVMTPRLLFFI